MFPWNRILLTVRHEACFRRSWSITAFSGTVLIGSDLHHRTGQNKQSYPLLTLKVKGWKSVTSLQSRLKIPCFHWIVFLHTPSWFVSQHELWDLLIIVVLPNVMQRFPNPHPYQFRRLLMLKITGSPTPKGIASEETLKNLTTKDTIPSNSPLMSLHPFLDSNGILQVSRREQKSKLAYSAMHPVGQTSTDETCYSIRASASFACWTNPPQFFSQLQVSYSRWPQIHMFYYP